MLEGVRSASHTSARFSAAADQLSCTRRISLCASFGISPSGRARLIFISISNKMGGFTCSQNSVMVLEPSVAMLSPYNDFLRSKFITRFLGHVFRVHVLRTLCARSDGGAMHWDSC